MVAVTVGSVVDFVTAVFVLSTMLSMGLGLTIDEILAPLRQRRLVARSLLVNLVLIPLLAFVVILIIPMETGYASGLLLIAMAPGASFGPKLAEVAKGYLGFASSLMVVLVLISVVTIPVTSALLLPGAITAEPLGIARTVVVAQLLPLSVGLGVRARYQPIATRLLPPVRRLSSHAFVLLVGLLLAINAGEILSLVGTGTLLAAVVVAGGALLFGYAFGGPAQRTRQVLATTTGVRNASIALLIATQNFADPNVLTMIVAFSVIGVIASGLIAGEWGKRARE
jgi:predicted Na+-dependent transporter